jgi:hypothetical protein
VERASLYRNGRLNGRDTVLVRRLFDFAGKVAAAVARQSRQELSAPGETQGSTH